MRLQPSEHYEWAEQLLEEAHSTATDMEHSMYLVAAAQVHATLATLPLRHTVTVPVRYPDQPETP